jgi:hypothetical protein
VDDLAADVVTHHFDTMIAPPGLTNFLGTVQVGHDLTAVHAVTFPPVSQGLALTGVLFVDGRVFESFGVPVAHAWRPDRVVRRAELNGLVIETTTVCAPGHPAVAMDVRVTNTGSIRRKATLSLAVNARVVQSGATWTEAESPSSRNSVEADPAGNRLVFRSEAGTAWSVQGLDRRGTVALSGVPLSPIDEFEVGIGGAGRGGELRVDLELDPGATDRFGYVQAVATTREDCLGVFDRVAADVPAVLAASQELWNGQLRAIFTPGNDQYSGHLPVLETSSDALRALYWWGALGVIWFRREFAGNVLGRSYDTVMPNYWSTTTFIWDFSLSSVVHALLDPVPMKRQLSRWIASDIHTHFGTSSLTGEPVGRWYSVNDYAMTRLVNDYVRFSGDVDFLREEINLKGGAATTVSGHLVDWSGAWRGLRGTGNLADYGEIDNLLECVSSYTHEVASLNAANVWCMRTVADIREHLGDRAEAQRLRTDAQELLPSVTGLYLEGTGHFAAGQPDGSRIPVRHCYDFNVVGTTIADDLDPSVRAEMVSFFQRDLQTPTWMRALSPWDPDASYSVRPDHQWNGAYPAWPADAARALIDLGAPEVALQWIEGLALTTNQGPPGQAHFVAEAMPTINGGARKAPPQLPYITDWACSSSGAWVALVLESVFGVNVGLDAMVTAGGCIAELDADAALRGLQVGDTSYDIHADGRVERS